ncbi:unnamed protein product [Echinostoma caproni]|uniref:MCM domain-containing protein n=1 Tax=Echinostoma caproni TaxID=27848 RepID=A0A183A013_9TREM|nr:unnamed protein product [Echinostoma caproni]
MVTLQEASEYESASTTADLGTAPVSVGRSPRCLTCRVNRDLVDSCLPGDVVHAAGCVGLLNPDGLAPSSHTGSTSWSARRGPSMFTLMLNVNSLIRLGGGAVIHSRHSSEQMNAVESNAGLLTIISVNEGNENCDPTRRTSDPGQLMSSLDNDFSIKDLYAIRDISEQPNLFRLLVASLCPTICGRAIVKAGLLLALFGGTQAQQRRRTRREQQSQSNDLTGRADTHVSTPTKFHTSEYNQSPSLSDIDEEISYRLGAAPLAPRMEPDDFGLNFDLDTNKESKNNADALDLNAVVPEEFGPTKRSSSHVLIVGDPGLGKSQMLRAAANLAPRVIYVCGNTATAAGLTVSTIRESNGTGGGFSLEAGALILADQGCCCIDEFDKLACDPAVLLEAMEQQTISVARGGLVANLPARASVLAAANPVGGHYDCTRRLDENLRVAPALLSR